jgi:hypothetical protein
VTATPTNQWQQRDQNRWGPGGPQQGAPQPSH